MATNRPPGLRHAPLLRRSASSIGQSVGCSGVTVDRHIQGIHGFRYPGDDVRNAVSSSATRQFNQAGGIPAISALLQRPQDSILSARAVAASGSSSLRMGEDSSMCCSPSDLSCLGSGRKPSDHIPSSANFSSLTSTAEAVEQAEVAVLLEVFDGSLNQNNFDLAQLAPKQRAAFAELLRHKRRQLLQRAQQAEAFLASVSAGLDLRVDASQIVLLFPKAAAIIPGFETNQPMPFFPRPQDLPCLPVDIQRKPVEDLFQQSRDRLSIKATHLPPAPPPGILAKPVLSRAGSTTSIGSLGSLNCSLDGLPEPNGGQTDPFDDAAAGSSFVAGVEPFLRGQKRSKTTPALLGIDAWTDRWDGNSAATFLEETGFLAGNENGNASCSLSVSAPSAPPILRHSSTAVYFDELNDENNDASTRNKGGRRVRFDPAVAAAVAAAQAQKLSGDSPPNAGVIFSILNSLGLDGNDSGAHGGLSNESTPVEDTAFQRPQRRTTTLPSNMAGMQIRATDVQHVLHLKGGCKPCAFYYNKKKGCRNGSECAFCHHEEHSTLTLKQWKKHQQRAGRALRQSQCDSSECVGDDSSSMGLSSHLESPTVFTSGVVSGGAGSGLDCVVSPMETDNFAAPNEVLFNVNDDASVNGAAGGALVSNGSEPLL